MQVWKYDAIPAETFAISMPRGAKPLHVAVQHGKPMLWALVDPLEPLVTHRFYMVGTGHDRPELMRHDVFYVGTFQMEGGALVFHIFWAGEQP